MTTLHSLARRDRYAALLTALPVVPGAAPAIFFGPEQSVTSPF
jgi:hypothetical protein